MMLKSTIIYAVVFSVLFFQMMIFYIYRPSNNSDITTVKKELVMKDINIESLNHRLVQLENQLANRTIDSYPNASITFIPEPIPELEVKINISIIPKSEEYTSNFTMYRMPLAIEPLTVPSNKTSDLINSMYVIKQDFKVAIEKYINYHNSIIQSGDAQARRDAKYLSFTPSGQLCNRIRGTVTAFTFALLTNRIFTMSDFGYKETRSYFELFKTPGFDIEANTKGYSKREETRISMELGQDMKAKTKKAEIFTCTNWDIIENDIHLYGTDYSTTFIYRNPYFEKRINELFIDEDLFRPILFWLFRPKDNIIKMKNDFITKFMLETNGNVKYSVGFHIRNEFPISESEWAAYRTCAKAVTPIEKKANSTWFIATDSETAQIHAKHMLRNNSLVYDATPFAKGSQLAGLKQALAEILIVSSSDRIFLTPFSSFSRVISMYAKTPHVYLVTDNIMPEQDTHRTLTKIRHHCYRYIKKEECSWPGHLTSVNQILKKMKCYNPSMISDIC